MNQNRAKFLEENARVLLKFSLWPMTEIEPLLRPGAIAAVKWLQAISEQGSTYQELAEAMGSNTTTAGQTMRALQAGGAVRIEKITSGQEKQKYIEAIVFRLDNPVRGR